MRTPVGVAMSAVMAVAALLAFSPRETAPLAASRTPVEQMQINALVRSKAAVLAGGELGILQFSRDQGRTWLRASLSQDRQALITDIAVAADGMTLMAVGHEGWVLRSEDGGLSWQEQAFDQKNGEPLLSIAQLPDGRWMAVGAFGRALVSDAAGRQWKRMELPPEVEDKHLNKVTGSADGRHWLIVGERGLLLKSDDAGRSWELQPAFYNGSFYGAGALAGGGWIVYGMRGNAFVSEDGGRSWHKSAVPAPLSFFAHSLAADGRITLLGQGGMLATSQDQGRSFSLSRSGRRANLTGMLALPEGQVLLASSAGLFPLNSDAAPAAAKPNAGAAR